MNPKMHHLIVQLAGSLGVNWHNRHIRVIFTASEKQPMRVYMFWINFRDGLIRVLINDLYLHSTESKMIIGLFDKHIAHNEEQLTTGFYNTCDFSFDSFKPYLQALRGGT